MLRSSPLAKGENKRRSSLTMRQFASLTTLLAAMTAACEDAGVTHQEESWIAQLEQSIINGTSVTRGSLAERGIVRVTWSRGRTGGLCTGTLLTNRFVLTARHCIRDGDFGNPMGFLRPNISVRLEGPTVWDDQFADMIDIFEPTGNLETETDFAIIELDDSIQVDGAANGFANNIFPHPDADLVGKEVFCAGYGNDTLATATQVASGAGRLRSARLEIARAGSSVLTMEPNSRGQIHANGDSGSTCFFQNPQGGLEVVGVLSSGSGSGTDIDGDGVVEGIEQDTITASFHASPGAYRAWAENIVNADVHIEVTTVPELSRNWLVLAHSPRGTAYYAYPNDPDPLEDWVPRGGWLTVEVGSEPPNYFCDAYHLNSTPVDGDVIASLSCMSNGLIPVLF